MRKSEIIANVLAAVSEETEIDIRAIVSRDRRREVVDARHMAIHLLYKYGVYQSSIADIFRTTLRNIRYIVSEFETRLAYSCPMRNDYERTKRRLGIIHETARKQTLHTHSAIR